MKPFPYLFAALAIMGFLVAVVGSQPIFGIYIVLYVALFAVFIYKSRRGGR